MNTNNSLEDYLDQSIAGFKQGQTFYEKARAYLDTKERLSAKELFLHNFFKKGYQYNSSPYRYGDLIELMVETADIDDFYNRILEDSFDKGNYDCLVNLENRLNEAKEKGEVIGITTSESTKEGGFYFDKPCGIMVSGSHQTVYSGVKVKDWYFKGETLYIIPEGSFSYKTHLYNCYNEFSRSEGGQDNCSWEIKSNPQLVKILSPKASREMNASWCKLEKKKELEKMKQKKRIQPKPVSRTKDGRIPPDFFLD